MKELIFERLNYMVENGFLRFGWEETITEFTLESYEKTNKETIFCICTYVEKGKVYKKFVELR